MKKLNTFKVVSFLLVSTVLMMGTAFNPSNPPNGNTGSPANGSTCGSCHSGGNYGGNVQITGIPATIMPSTAYPMSVIITKTTGTPSKAGFSLKSEVAGANVGTFTAGTSNSVSSGYVRQSNAISYSGGSTVTYNFTWTSPASYTNGTAISFYVSTVIANGNGSTSGDQVVGTNVSGTYQAAATPLTVTQVSATNVTCNGGSNGTATVNASGGSGCTYAYTWSNGQTGATATNLIAGTYTVTATCGASTGTKSVTITQPTALSFSSTSSQSVNCLGLGSVTATLVGGTAPYTYLWSNTKTGATVSVSAGGTYTVTATDFNGCTKTTSVSVGSNTTPPTASIQTSGGLTCISSNVTLSNSLNLGNYSYQWQAQTGGAVSTSSTLSVTQAGTYNLTVTDTNTGCTATSIASIQENKTAPNANVSNVNPTLSCTTTSLVLDASTSTGTSTPLGFVWTGPGITSGASTSKATINKSGNYTVKVTDNANGCTTTKLVSVLENTTPPTITATGGTLTCAQTSLVLTTIASPTNVTYNWSGPSNFTSTNANPSISNAGSYVVTATGANGCKSTATAVVVADKTAPTINIQGSTAICSGNSTNLTAAVVGTNPTYLWSNTNTTNAINVTTAGTYTITVTTANGCSNSAAVTVTDAPQPTVTLKNDTLTCSKSNLTINATTTSNLSNISWSGPNNFSSTVLTPLVTTPGTYTVTVTSTQGCTAQFSNTIYQDTSIPVVSITGAPTICEGTVAILTATPNLGTYLWSNGSAGNVLTTNVPGAYTVEVTNTAGCKSSAIVNVKVSALPNVSVADVKACEGDDAELKAVVTNAPNATYSWSSSTNYTSATQNALISKATPANNGSYYVLAINEDGCVGRDTATLSVSPKMNIALATKTTCDSITVVTATNAGGIGPYKYEWSNSNVVSNPLTVKAPATVALTITDSYGCVASSQPLTIAAPIPMTLTSTIVKQQADVLNSGKITLDVKGGAAPYTYLWSNGATSKDLIDVKAGKYCVTVTDANSCTKSECFEILKETIGTEDNVIAQAVKVFPNPAHEFLMIETSGNVQFESIQLFDDKGKLMQQFKADIRKIELSDFPDATYFLKLQTHEGFAIKRIVKMK